MNNYNPESKNDPCDSQDMGSCEQCQLKSCTQCSQNGTGCQMCNELKLNKCVALCQKLSDGVEKIININNWEEIYLQKRCPRNKYSNFVMCKQHWNKYFKEKWNNEMSDDHQYIFNRMLTSNSCAVQTFLIELSQKGLDELDLMVLLFSPLAVISDIDIKFYFMFFQLYFLKKLQYDIEKGVSELVKRNQHVDQNSLLKFYNPQDDYSIMMNLTSLLHSQTIKLDDEDIKICIYNMFVMKMVDFFKIIMTSPYQTDIPVLTDNWESAWTNSPKYQNIDLFTKLISYVKGVFQKRYQGQRKVLTLEEFSSQKTK